MMQNTASASYDDTPPVINSHRRTDALNRKELASQRELIDADSELSGGIHGFGYGGYDFIRSSVYFLTDGLRPVCLTEYCAEDRCMTVRGDRNNHIDEKYHAEVARFITGTGALYGRGYPIFGHAFINGKLFHYRDIPENTHITGNLVISGLPVTGLPRGLRIDGNLYADNCGTLTHLPTDIAVKGYMFLNGCTALNTIPAGMQTGAGLYLKGCTALIHLPAGLYATHLDISGCTALESLPADLTVDGSLCVESSVLPKDIPSTVRYRRIIRNGYETAGNFHDASFSVHSS